MELNPREHPQCSKAQEFAYHCLDLFYYMVGNLVLTIIAYKAFDSALGRTDDHSGDS